MSALAHISLSAAFSVCACNPVSAPAASGEPRAGLISSVNIRALPIHHTAQKRVMLTWTRRTDIRCFWTYCHLPSIAQEITLPHEKTATVQTHMITLLTPEPVLAAIYAAM
eukprot:647817-Amphidinium_carterae.1